MLIEIPFFRCMRQACGRPVPGTNGYSHGCKGYLWQKCRRLIIV
jgi:hypothetical protein